MGYGNLIGNGAGYANQKDEANYTHGTTMTGGQMPTPREPAISQQCALLEKRVSVLHDVISQVEQRLSAVIVQDQPTPSSVNQAKEGMVPVPMAQVLAAMNERLHGAYERLNSLLNRIEL